METVRTHLSPRCCCTSSVRDRKSTRLNSSHGYISYAVFCLKKKNNSDGPYHGELAELQKNGWHRRTEDARTVHDARWERTFVLECGRSCGRDRLRSTARISD